MSEKVETIFEEVKKIIVEQLGVAEDKVSLDSTIMEDLGADSLDTVELLMAFEEKFKKEIPDTDAQNLKTVRDVVTYIEKHLN
ncbi:MAG: acyl carrier protein [Chlamydiia bacterium]